MWDEGSYETRSFEPGSWFFGLVKQVVEYVMGGAGIPSKKRGKPSISNDDDEVMEIITYMMRFL
jgi:hypothetical protein